jgi:hypothetical protein
MPQCHEVRDGMLGGTRLEYTARKRPNRTEKTARATLILTHLSAWGRIAPRADD